VSERARERERERERERHRERERESERGRKEYPVEARGILTSIGQRYSGTEFAHHHGGHVNKLAPICPLEIVVYTCRRKKCMCMCIVACEKSHSGMRGFG